MDDFNVKYSGILVFTTLLIVLIFINNIVFVLLVPILIIFYLRFNYHFILFISILTFLTLPNTIDSSLRLIVQITNYLLLIYLFISYYGLEFRKYPKVPPVIILFLFGVLILMLISSLASKHVLDGISHLVRLALFLVLVYIYYSFIKSLKEIKLYILSILVCSLVYFIVLQAQLYELNYDLATFFSYQVTEIGNEYIGKNYLGTFFSILILLLIAISFNEKYKSRKFTIFLILSMLLVSLVITNSRASLFCLSIAVLYLLFTFRKRLFVRSIIAIIVTFLVIYLSPFRETIETYMRIDNLGTGREYLFTTSAEIISNNFLFGTGPGGTKYELYPNLPYMLGSIQEFTISRNYEAGEIGQSHNFYLFFFSDLGIIGLILALSFPLIFFRICYLLIKNMKSVKNEEYYIVQAIVGIGIFLFVRGIFEPKNILSYGGITSDLPFWLMISIISFFYMKYYAEKKSI